MLINTRFKELTDLHIKPEGKSETVRGELIRAVNRIGYRFFNDGDQIGIGYGNETCNAAGRYIGKYGNDEMAKILGTLWDQMCPIQDSGNEIPDRLYDERLSKLIDATVAYVDSNDPALDQEATDMLDLREKEDEDYDNWDEEDDCWEDDEYDEPDDWEDEEYED